MWYFLAECSLSEFLPDHAEDNRLTAGILSQVAQKLEMPPACADSIEMTLSGFEKKELGSLKPARSELPWRIRIFCQEKMVVNANSAKTLPLTHAEPGAERKPVVPDPGAKTKCGWGYFLIERGGNPSSGSSMSSRDSIDLYLYQEGR
jgi:hypothetical protein